MMDTFILEKNSPDFNVILKVGFGKKIVLDSLSSSLWEKTKYFSR